MYISKCSTTHFCTPKVYLTPSLRPILNMYNDKKTKPLVTNRQGCHLQSHRWSILAILALLPYLYQVGIHTNIQFFLSTTLLSQKPSLLSQLLTIEIPSTNPIHVPSKKSSGQTYPVTSVDHYFGPGYITTNVTSEI